MTQPRLAADLAAEAGGKPYLNDSAEYRTALLKEEIELRHRARWPRWPRCSANTTRW